MYKYLLFAFDSHEADGGMDDLVLKFNTFEEFYNEYDYKDVSNYQLVYTNDFSYREFNSSIIYHVGIDEYREIKKKREEEFINWLVENLN